MVKALFIGANAKCRHTRVLEEHEKECWECRFEEAVMKMKPPFELVCVRAGIGVKKDFKYSVQAVIRQGADSKGNHKYGIILKGEHEWAPRIYSLDDFYFPPKETANVG